MDDDCRLPFVGEVACKVTSVVDVEDDFFSLVSQIDEGINEELVVAGGFAFGFL